MEHPFFDEEWLDWAFDANAINNKKSFTIILAFWVFSFPITIFFVTVDFRASFDQLVISPLGFVHPSKEDEQQFDERFFIERITFFMLLQLSHNLIADVDDVGGATGFPVSFLVFALDEEFDVVNEAG